MTRIISIHEYKLRDNISGEQFETAVEEARHRGLFNLPGLVGYHFLKHIRGTRTVEYAAIWIYQDGNSWEKLWGKVDQSYTKEKYPEMWKIWEDEILAPLITQDPDHIFYAAYEELRNI
jgi:hypothetical protein